MNILYVNTNFHEGGAAKIARQLYYGMKERGHNVYFLAGYPSKDDEECIIMNPSVVSKIYNIGTGILQNNQVISRQKARKTILKIVEEKKIDIVHFHNLFENYIGIKDISYIAKRCRVVWTLHDMWAATGHCAYSYYCNGWERGCRKCKENRFYPAFYYNDVRYKYKLKGKYFSNQGITYVVPSLWLKDICEKSYLSNENIHLIENGINTSIYRPLDRERLREEYNVDNNKTVLFFTAAVVQHWGKGIKYLLNALRMLENKEKYVLFVAGNGELKEELQGFEVHNMGFIRNEEKMNELYNLADIYINPSMAESFGCTAAEAAASGTAIIAFANGGLKEIVTDDTGWLVEPGNSEALSKTIEIATQNKEIIDKKRENAVKRASEMYKEERMLNRYEQLYHKLLIESR